MFDPHEASNEFIIEINENLPDGHQQVDRFWLDALQG